MMEKASTNIQLVKQSSSAPFLLLLAIILLVAGSWLAFKQQPRLEVFKPVTLIDRLFYPNEQNAFQRLPKISPSLNDVFALQGTDLVWATGDDGLIIHSRDGGRTWQQQYPKQLTAPDSENQTQSLLDWVAKPAVAADPVENKTLGQAPDKKRQVLSKRNEPNKTSEVLKQVDLEPRKRSMVQPSEKEQFSVTQTEIMPVLRSIFFINAYHGWAVGFNGTILSTTDGGRTWGPQKSETKKALFSVHFVDADCGWAVGAHGTILSTADGGKTWVQQSSETKGDLYSVHFIDADRGWVVGLGGMILSTTDGGKTWLAQSSGEKDRLDSVHFIDAAHGWAVGWNGIILSTTDGGMTWARQSSETKESLQSVYFMDAERGRVVGGRGTILSTTDGGKTWVTQSSGTKAGLYSVHLIDAGRGWAVGSRGAVLATHDGGESWHPQSHEYAQWLYSLHFINEQLGWAFGSRGTILHTSNGGESWQPQDSAVDQSLHAMFFIDDKLGWAAGNEGSIVHTRDGGRSWHSQASGTEVDFRAVQFINSNLGWVAGSDGTVLKTTDGGKNWQAQPADSIGSFMSADFINAESGWLAESNGQIYRTTDGGDNWLATAGSKYMLRAIDMLDTRFGWAVGDGNTIIVTTDGGKSWQNQKTKRRGVFSGVSFIDKKQGWVVGSEGTVLHTNNAGENWQLQNSGTDRWLQSVSFIDTQNGWAVGRQFTLRYTEDGGKSWKEPKYKKYPAGWYTLFCTTVILLCWAAYRSPQQDQKTEETITDLLASDRPLQPGDPDPLGFNDIAQGLSRFLRNPRTEPPLTIAVTGEWGSGKSSLMNLLHQDLKDKGFSTVWFNAWHHQKSEQLLASLFANIRTQAIPGSLQFSGLRPVGLIFRLRLLKLRSQQHWFSLLSVVLLVSVLATLVLSGNGPLHEIEAWAQHQVDMLSARMKIVTGIVTSLGTATAILFGLGKSMQGFALNPLRLMTVSGKEGQKSAAVDPGARYQFAQEFGNVTQSLDLGRMIIFIDDLDRCGKENVLEVLEAINFLVSSGNCYIIIGMAPEWVKICVGLGFKELAEESYAELNNGSHKEPVEHRRQFASQYLEKMINIEVPVPKLDEEKAQRLTVPEFQQVELSAFDVWTDKALRLVRQNRVILAMCVVVVLGAGIGKSAIFNFSVPVKPEAPEPQLIRQWAAQDLQWLQHERGEPLIPHKPVTSNDKEGDMNLPELQWQLKAEPQALTKGVLVEEFAEGKLKLFLKQDEKEQRDQSAGDNGNSYVGHDENNPDEETSSTDQAKFKAGQVSQPTWHRFIPGSLLLIVVCAAVALFFRKSERVVKDSQSFRKAMNLWQPYLMLRPQSPRKIKRFLNHLRYLAMRYRQDEPPKSRWEKWRKPAVPEQPAIESFSEPSLVALSMLYYLDPSWVKETRNFAMINQLKVSEATTGIKFANPSEQSRLIQQLEETVQQHFELFNVEQLATPEQRELFLAAQGLVAE